MTELRLKSEGGEFYLLAEGHAGYAAKGGDIVCAGISALIFALGAQAESMWRAGMLEKKPKLHFSPGRAEIGFRPKACRRERAAGAFETAAAGLRLIAADYPENLKISQIERMPPSGRKRAEKYEKQGKSAL